MQDPVGRLTALRGGERPRPKRLLQSLVDAQPWIKGAGRVLEDHLELGAAFAQLSALESQEVQSIDPDLPGVGLQGADQAAPEGCLSAS